MAEARRRDEWDRTSNVLAQMANCNRDPEARPEPFEAADFNPFLQNEVDAEADPKWSRTVLKAAFVGNQKVEHPQGKEGATCEKS